MPSPFNSKLFNDMAGTRAQPEGISFRTSGNGPPGGLNPFVGGLYGNQNSDRRLPMLDRIKGAGNTYSNIPLNQLTRRQKEFDGWQDMKYLGENMVRILIFLTEAQF